MESLKLDWITVAELIQTHILLPVCGPQYKVIYSAIKICEFQKGNKKICGEYKFKTDVILIIKQSADRNIFYPLNRS